MNGELHRHLDGDIPAEALDVTDREEADEWDRMVASFRQAAPRGGAPPWLEQRVMAELEALPEPGPLRRALGWIVRPAPVRVSPLTVGLAAAALVVALLPRSAPESGPSGVQTAGSASAEPVVYVQFVLEAPSASSVAVAGDFSGWEPSFTLTDPDGDGVWSARIPVRPGVHGYMFLIDETRWQTDPNAERYQDDGFGNRNAVLAVGASG
jgi:hypothetical protein